MQCGDVWMQGLKVVVNFLMESYGPRAGVIAQQGLVGEVEEQAFRLRNGEVQKSAAICSGMSPADEKTARSVYRWRSIAGKWSRLAIMVSATAWCRCSGRRASKATTPASA